MDLIEDLCQQNPECIFLCITEHWKSELQLQSLGIRNYQLVSSFCRGEGQHGGAAIYSKNNIKYRVCSKLCSYSVVNEFEVAAAEFTVDKLPIIIITIYRPSGGNVQLFLSKFDQMLTETFLENRVYFIVGDFNIELKEDNNDKAYLISILDSFNLHQSIFEYTRITPESKSCIDNIFTNHQDYNAYVINTVISDHFAQKILFNVNREKSNFVYQRYFSKKNITEFVKKLQEQSWENVYKMGMSDVNGQWDSFLGLFLNIFNENFPTKKINLASRKSKIMRSQEVIDCKHKLDVLLVMSQHNHCYREMYNTVKKQYDNLLKITRKQMYENQIEKSDNKGKCVWEICREITGGKRVGGRECQIGFTADDYNDFLLSVVPEMLKNNRDNHFECNITENNKSIFFMPVTPEEIGEIINALKHTHSYGCDDVPTAVIKACKNEVSDILSYIVNNSFCFGIFPSQLKFTHIIPIHKKGDTGKMENYRPISLLPGFSKIFERAVCVRLINFMTDCNRFTNTQHGYLKGRSTQTALFEYIQNTLDHLENRNLAMGIFLDLSRAYDCVNHENLLLKLEKHGIRGIALEWFRSYLSDRKQVVRLRRDGETIKSGVLGSSLGIPQGSVIGPIIFIIYINDLYFSTVKNTNCSITNYADDTSLLIGAGTYPELVEQSNRLLSDVSSWFVKNNLILNKDKTNIILFHTKQNRIEIPDSITLGDTELQLMKNTKFLGLQIDESLDWSQHIDSLCSRLSQVCYSIRVMSRYVDRRTLNIVYYANFESILKYGIIFWGSSYSTRSLFIVQKKVIRIINQMKYDDTCRGVFRENSVMTVYAVYIYECLIFIFRHKEKFVVNNHDHQHNTRTIDINYPIHRLTLTEKAPFYMCIKLFNKLPSEVRTIPSVKKFKRNVKNLLISLEPYSCREYLDSDLTVFSE